MSGFVYPDGRALLDQPCVLLEAFAVIGQAFADIKASDVQD